MVGFLREKERGQKKKKKERHRKGSEEKEKRKEKIPVRTAKVLPYNSSIPSIISR